MIFSSKKSGWEVHQHHHIEELSKRNDGGKRGAGQLKTGSETKSNQNIA